MQIIQQVEHIALQCVDSCSYLRRGPGAEVRALNRPSEIKAGQWVKA